MKPPEPIIAEPIPGYFVAGYDESDVKRMSDLVRQNVPFLGACVRHNGGPERVIVAINRRAGAVLLDDEADYVPWAECAWR